MSVSWRRASLAAAVLCCGNAIAWAAPPTLKGVDLYRSRSITLARARQAVAPLLDSYLKVRSEPRSQKTAARLKKQIEDRLLALGGLAFASLSVGDYVTSAERTVYVTFDFVDVADAKTRMPFRAAPRGAFADPGGLLAAWQSYSELGEALSRQGLFDISDHPKCPGFYCLWGSPTPELARLEKQIAAGAVARRPELEGVVRRDADATKRAAALYVLSYLPEGDAVVALAIGALGDPAEVVRSAALQVLADVALYHRKVLIDLNKIVLALDYPTVSDRAKALSVLVGLAQNPAYAPRVMTRATPSLLGLLRLRQPADHDLAFTVLSTLSQESFGQRDFAAWTRWVQSKAAARASELPGAQTDDGP